MNSFAETAVPFELELLSGARNYRDWISDSVKPHLGDRILEVGAGIGNMSRSLPMRELLVLSEADPALLPMLEQSVIEAFHQDPRAKVHKIDLSRDWKSEFFQYNFDTIVSFNVLEHIEDDIKTIRDLAGILRRSESQGPKRIVTFVPAHSWLFGSFDRSFGHYRRYTKASFKAIVEQAIPGTRLEARYFNIFSVPAWFWLGRILKKKRFPIASVGAFERICPWVRGFDDLLHKVCHFPVGQSLLAVLTIE